MIDGCRTTNTDISMIVLVIIFLLKLVHLSRSFDDSVVSGHPVGHFLDRRRIDSLSTMEEQLPSISGWSRVVYESGTHDGQMLVLEPPCSPVDQGGLFQKMLIIGRTRFAFYGNGNLKHQGSGAIISCLRELILIITNQSLENPTDFEVIFDRDISHCWARNYYRNLVSMVSHDDYFNGYYMLNNHGHIEFAPQNESFYCFVIAERRIFTLGRRIRNHRRPSVLRFSSTIDSFGGEGPSGRLLFIVKNDDLNRAREIVEHVVRVRVIDGKKADNILGVMNRDEFLICTTLSHSYWIP